MAQRDGQRRGSNTRWVLALALVAAGPALADSRVEAKRHFKLGMALIAQQHYDDGIAELLEAYTIRPHPNVLFNIAKAHEAAGRPADALTFYRRYLDADPPDSGPVRERVLVLEAALPKKEEPPPPTRPTTPTTPPANGKPAPAVDAETVARLTALAERLERAVAKEEARVAEPARPAPAAEAAAAPPEAPEDFSRPYEETVVAASRRAQSTLEAPNATTVITGEEIRASGLTTLPEILRRVPGAEVMAMGLESHNVSFRGFNQRIANKVLLLIDGRPEYQDFLGVTMWSLLPIGVEEIERVEVIRGPGSALYGANAMLGIVNIITRAPGTGPRAELAGLLGNANYGGGSLVASGGETVKFRASAGYLQGDKYSRDYDASRPDVVARMPDPDLGYRSARANLTTYYAFNKDFSVAASGGVNRLVTEIYAIGLLRNFSLDGLGAYAKADATLGPVRLRFFWNHLDAVAGPQYEPVGQRSLATALESNVFDGEVFFQKDFTLAGTHRVGLGASVRGKRLKWTYLGPLHQEIHAAAFVQDEWRILKPLSLVASYRIDRHPLLDNGKPGYAQSPRVSLTYLPFEGHAFRASFATAFREPTFLESYMDLRTPVPGVNGASVLTQGNPGLRPERLISFELGYRGELAEQALSWELAGYWNIVSDLVVLSAVNRLPADEAWDAPSASFLLGRSLFVNDPTTYTARGAELGLSWAPLRGLDLRVSAGLQQIVPNTPVAVCGPCSQAPAVKLNGGFTYRTPVRLDLSADVSYTSATVWVEREPSAADPTQIVNTQNALGGYLVVNARVGYRLLDDRLSVAVVGSQLGPNHQEHPFGNDVNRRIFAQITVRP